LEERLKNNLIKDDLVQLFGYYQYTNRNSILMEIENKGLNKKRFWTFVKNLSNGLIVGQTLHFERYLDQFNLQKAEFYEILKEIKILGYDVRNHNTNSQIQPNYYLIPYAFPTINAKSVQRFKSL
jgi:DNA (cytosine-5)-methyltransferase 1